VEQLKAYAEYKDSSIPWLGRVPKHWEVTRFNNISWIKSTCGRPDLNLLSVYLNRGVVAFSDVDEKRTNATAESLDAYQVVEPGDLVLNNQQAWRGSVGVSLQHGIVSPAYIILGLRSDIDSSFANSLFRSRDMVCNYVVCSKGVGTIQRNLHWPLLKDAKVWLPPPSEQSAIARFLAALDRWVNRFVRAKRRLIELLTEQKQAIITHAVTRGLNPNAKLKPSGIDWLGDVPEHWRISRIKSELQNLNMRRVPLNGSVRGKMTRREYDYYGASGVIDKVDDFLFDDELLLIAEDGANLVLRNLPLAIIARGKFWVNNHAHILKPLRGSLEYFAALLESIDYSVWISGAAQPKLTQDRLMAIRIPAPPPAEQLEIVNYISGATKVQSETIDRTRREIDLIREYRTRLVADVVTGKLDVRDAVARLSEDEAEPAEPIDVADDGDEAGDEATVEPELVEESADS
jgi:type I restriction enzyme S subunit